MAEQYVRMPLVALARPDVTPAAKLVYGALLSYAWDDVECYPSMEQLARRAGVVERTARRALDELVSPAVRWLDVGSAPGKRHRYRILGPRPPPEAVGVNGSTPDKLSGVNGSYGARPRTVLPGTPDSFAGVGGQVDQGTPDILSPELNARTKRRDQTHSPERSEAVPNTENARARAAAKVREKMDAQAAWRASRGER